MPPEPASGPAPPVDVLQTIGELGVVPVVVIDQVDQAEPLGAALIAGGLPCAEITMRTEAALSSIETLTRTFPEMLVGAGTVLTVDQAQAAVDAGSGFVVSPGFDAGVVDWCVAHQVPVVPGVMTPTEITKAMGRGLRLLKFFPAEAAGGVETLRSVGAAFPRVEFMPTGGIGAHNLADYLRLPMVAACGGSWLAGRRLLADGAYAEIERRAAEAVGIVRNVRGAG